MSNVTKTVRFELRYGVFTPRRVHGAELAVRLVGPGKPQWRYYRIGGESARLVGRHLHGVGPVPRFVVADYLREHPGDIPDAPRAIIETVADALTEVSRNDNTTTDVEKLWLDSSLICKKFGLCVHDEQQLIRDTLGDHPEIREVRVGSAWSLALTGEVASAWVWSIGTGTFLCSYCKHLTITLGDGVEVTLPTRHPRRPAMLW
jgi:hypothetical protein